MKAFAAASSATGPATARKRLFLISCRAVAIAANVLRLFMLRLSLRHGHQENQDHHDNHANRKADECAVDATAVAADNCTNGGTEDHQNRGNQTAGHKPV